MDRIDQREAAIRRVERAARELRDAQLELAELTESAAELAAFVLHGEDRPATHPRKPFTQLSPG